jgi:hypothetical protein
VVPLPAETGDTGYTGDSAGQDADFRRILAGPRVPGFLRDPGQQPGTAAAMRP